MNKAAKTAISRQRFRIGRGSIRLAVCLCAGLVGAATLIAVVGIRMNALEISRPLGHTAAFLGLVAMLALASIVWVVVKRRFAGWLTITDDGLQVEIGASVRFVPWAKIRTVSHAYRTIIHDDRTARVQARASSEDSGLLMVEALGRESVLDGNTFASDPWTIVIVVDGMDRPVILLAGAIYDYKRAFDAVLAAIRVKLADRMG